MLKLLGIVAGAYCLGTGVMGILRGRVQDGGRGNDKVIDCEDSPGNFWATCLFYVGFGGLILWNLLTG